MNASVKPLEQQATAAQDEAGRAAIHALADAAGRRIAPLWPLKHFVAVNPFLGVTDQDFTGAARLIAQTTGGAMVQPRAWYLAQIDAGVITDTDLDEALDNADPALGLPGSAAALRALLASDAPAGRPAALDTVAHCVGRLDGRDWAGFCVERISAWAAAWFDQGQAAWRSPWRDAGPWQAWREEAMIDRSPELAGLRGFRTAVAALPADPLAAIAGALDALEIPPAARLTYCHRLLGHIGGWAAFARYQVWQRELYGDTDDTLIELLAIRLAWDAILKALFSGHSSFASAWLQARNACAATAASASAGVSADALSLDCLLQEATERAWQRRFVSTFNGARHYAPTKRPLVQAAFCIDVRSEVFRRALEARSPHIETIGFAGFFGFPIEYVPLGQQHGGAQCPVLLTPKFVVCETVHDADADEHAEILGLRLMRRRAARAFKSFKMAAVSSFGFVETLAPAYLAKLATDALGMTRTVPHPATDGIDAQVRGRLGPTLDSHELGERSSGFTATARVDMAEAVLKAMSLTENFARIVLLAGHGSSTVNNPHATGLDCGACGGHTGEANARVAAAILNEPATRLALAERGLVIPEDTLFIGALHDTTTDEVRLFTDEPAPASHRHDLEQLQAWLAFAGHAARAERAPTMRIPADLDTDSAVLARSHDWSQVRPEWGLAGCAAFIAAPRKRSRHIDLQGRAFLHSYDWRADEDFGTLELIMTAPLVVASWISLQYYGSSTDNEVFGSGNKVLHNVVGTLGVLEGNGGDLRTGLPWQSVHDGERLVHEPLRLSAFIEAPIEAMNAVIARNDGLRDLVDNRWLHLFAIDNAGRVHQRYAGDGRWQRLDVNKTAQVEQEAAA